MSDWLGLRSRWLAGDTNAYEALCKQMRTVAYGVAYATLRRHADAEDVAQKVVLSFLRINEQLPEYEHQAALIFRVHAAARRLALERSGGEASASRRSRDEIRRCLARLTDSERGVMQLHLLGCAKGEIALYLDLPVDVVRDLLERATLLVSECEESAGVRGLGE